MTKRVEELEAFLASLAPEMREVRKAQNELDQMVSKLTCKVSDYSETIDKSEFVDGEEEDICDNFESFGCAFGMTWSGAYDYGDGYAPGDRVEYWVPSTC